MPRCGDRFRALEAHNSQPLRCAGPEAKACRCSMDFQEESVTIAEPELAVEVGRGMKEVDFPITVNGGGLVIMGYGLGWTSFMVHGHKW